MYLLSLTDKAFDRLCAKYLPTFLFRVCYCSILIFVQHMEYRCGHVFYHCTMHMLQCTIVLLDINFNSVDIFRSNKGSELGTITNSIYHSL